MASFFPPETIQEFARCYGVGKELISGTERENEQKEG